MELIDLNQDVQLRLQSAGWSTGREHDIKAWIDVMNQRGFPYLQYPVKLLAVLGALDINNVLEGASHLPIDRLQIDPTLCDLKSLRYCEQKVGKPLYPLGQADEIADVFISDDGEWFLHYSGIWKLGNNANEALRYILFGKGKAQAIFLPA